jgi:CubicO group peptidase (beta-lactamase class C family)
MNTSLNESVQQLIDRFVESGAETGLQVAAYVDGDLVVDAWSGQADDITGRPVDGETLFTAWSTTKGWVATCLHILVDRGLVNYDTPVAVYWPEFAANGKDSVSVRHALSHMAGVPQMPDGVTPEMMTNWDIMSSAIASHAPLWQPGTQPGYHAWTFGWIIGEIIRRADGRPIDQFAREELCQPLGIQDFYLGIPDDVEGRVATLRQDTRHRTESEHLSDLARRVMPPQVTTADVVNRPDFRRAVIPGGGGIMSARAIARHYAMLACGGMLDRVRVLSPERIDVIRALQTDAVDLVSGSRSRKALGYALGGESAQGGDIAMGRSGDEFGHGGNGGSLGFADPKRKLGFGLTKSLMKAEQDYTASAAYQVSELIRQYIDRQESG